MIIDLLRLNPFWTNFWLPSAIYLHLGGQLNVNVCLFISNICRQIISFSRMDNDICHLLYGEIVPREAIKSTKLCLEIRPYKPYKNPDLYMYLKKVSKRVQPDCMNIMGLLWKWMGTMNNGWKRAAADLLPIQPLRRNKHNFCQNPQFCRVLDTSSESLTGKRNLQNIFPLDAWTPEADFWRLSLMGKCHHDKTVFLKWHNMCILFLCFLRLYDLPVSIW